MITTSPCTSNRYDALNPDRYEPVIPGLPDHIAEHCLLHLPFPYPSLLRSVSPSWNKALLSPSFLLTKSKLSLSIPRLFVFSFHPQTLRIQCQSLDPVSHQWFLLPQIPLSTPIHPCYLVCGTVASRGEMFLLGGDGNCLVYRATTNTWSVLGSMTVPGVPLAVGEVSDGRIVAVNENSGELSAEIFDPITDRWDRAAVMLQGIERYDAATINGRVYLTEGWAWPFDNPPRGAVYDAAHDTWQEMPKGMREGWTGSSAIINGTLYIVTEYGDNNLKLYDKTRDEWRPVRGGGVPKTVRRPYAVVGGGDEGRLYVIGKGLEVAIGRVEKVEIGEEKVEWDVIKGPQAFTELLPCNAQVLLL
ncbi:galactose oxidase/kelch repeat superfamily protein [Carex rostrata]